MLAECFKRLEFWCQRCWGFLGICLALGHHTNCAWCCTFLLNLILPCIVYICALCSRVVKLRDFIFCQFFVYRIQWSQFKGYFIFKLEKVMDDFRTSAPEPRGPPNPNVEYIPFDEMKERILKIVTGFNGYVLNTVLNIFYKASMIFLLLYLVIWYWLSITITSRFIMTWY